MLGETPDVGFSKRVPDALSLVRDVHSDEVRTRGLVVWPGDDSKRVWTWAGLKANATLLAGLELDAQGVENDYVDLPNHASIADVDVSAVPNPGLDAVTGLKFSAALPPELAARTLGERLADPVGARASTGASHVLVKRQGANAG